MPKIKTNRSAAKRFSFTKSGKVKRMRAYKSHILNKKDTKRKRRLRQGTYCSIPDAKFIKRLIPYK